VTFAKPGNGLGVARDIPIEFVREKVDDALDVAGPDSFIEPLDDRTRVLCHGFASS
jgi:hypothetical protein